MATLQERFDSVLKIIDEHNKALCIPADPTFQPVGFVISADFLTKLQAMGGTSIDRLEKLTVEDLLRCFDGEIKPVLLAKSLIKVLRGTHDGTPKEQGVITTKRADKMTQAELLQNYDPTDPDSAIAKRLDGMAKGKAFIVFTDSGSVILDATGLLLHELRQGYPERKLMKVGAQHRQVYKVGERPDLWVDENPLYPGRPLRPDGTCDQTNRSWEGVPLADRQLIRIALNQKLILVSLDKAHDILDIAVSPMAIAMLRERYPSASVEFDSLSKLGDLPKLKVKLSAGRSDARPFDKGRKVQPKPRKIANAKWVYAPASLEIWQDRFGKYQSDDNNGWTYKGQR